MRVLRKPNPGPAGAGCLTCVVKTCMVESQRNCRYIHSLEEQRRSPIWHPYHRHVRRWLRSAENPVLHVAVGLWRNSLRAGRLTDSFSAPARRLDLRLGPSALALAIFPEILGDAGPGDAGRGVRFWRACLGYRHAHLRSCARRSAPPGRPQRPHRGPCPRRRAAASSSRLRGRSSAVIRRPGMAGDPVGGRCPGPGALR